MCPYILSIFGGQDTNGTSGLIFGVAYVVSGTSSNFNSDTRLLIEFSKTMVLENVPCRSWTHN